MQNVIVVCVPSPATKQRHSVEIEKRIMEWKTIQQPTPTHRDCLLF